MNIRLNNLLESHGASRELQRDIIRFMNTIIRDKDRFGMLLITYTIACWFANCYLL